MNKDLPIDLARLNDLDPTPQDSQAAAALLAELRTRVTTRTIHARSGDEESAIASIHSIIPGIRRILRFHPEARRFEVVAESIIDHLLRPHLNRWHGWITKEKLKEEDLRRTFRRELADLQPALRRACDLLDKIRAQQATLVPDDLFMGIAIVGDGVPTIRSRRALAEIEARIEGDFPQCEKLLEAEKTDILGADHEDGKLKNAAGLALSGGGIRSATFALGIVQVLATRGLFRQFHYLSTVSGGGYLGTFLSSYLNDENRKIEEVFDPDDSTDTAPVRHLRNNSKYLLDGGLGNQVRSLSMVVFGILSHFLVLMPFVAVFALVTNLLGKAGFWGAGSWWTATMQTSGHGLGSTAYWSFITILCTALAMQLLVRPLVAFFTRGPEESDEPGSKKAVRRDLEYLANWLSVTALLAGAFAAIPSLFGGFNALVSGKSTFAMPEWLTAVVSAVLPFVSGPLAAKLSGRKYLGPLLRIVFFLSGPLLLLGLYLVLTKYFFGLGAWPVAAVVGIIAYVVFFWLALDLNALSPHHMYRRQLAKCYLVRRGADEGGGTRGDFEIEPREDLKLSGIGRGKDAPYHLINSTINLPASKDKELRGRKGDFFLFSRNFCGSPITDYVSTEDKLERADPNFDLGSAMAVAGAAFSSNMGVKDLDHFRFLLTLLNVRLGYWVPNCMSLDERRTGRILKGRKTPGPLFLFREMFGRMTEEHAFFNLSDGGHIENLGVQELLRRHAKFIVSVDGECDPDRFFDGLVKLIRYARIDLGAEIEIDPEDLAKDENGFSPAHCLLGRIIYADKSVGWLLYLKLSLTGDESPDILDYKREQPAFPHQTTLDQLYSEKQFESYRALGQHVAEELFRKEILQTKCEFFAARSENGDTHLPGWFEALAMNLLPDNNPVFRSDPSNLESMNVGISISVSTEASDEVIQKATVSVSQMLIGIGASVVFGHDWRDDGVMKAIAEFARNDRLAHHRDRQLAIINRYLKGTDKPAMADWELFETGLIDREELDGDVFDLRADITDRSDARICLGGKMKRKTAKFPDGFTGSIPGIMEEAWRAAKAGNPVLISGCLGGAAEWMAKRLLDETPDVNPTYTRPANDKTGGEFPKTAEKLVEEIKESFTQLPQELKDLHMRLWQTTTLDAAIAVMEEILGLEKRRSDEGQPAT